MTLAGIAQHRMINQQIACTGFQQPQEIVAWLGAVQAQEYALSKWAIGLRLKGSTDADIETAFTNGVILRTHLLRPTWHFVTPPDIRWLLTLTAPGVNGANAFIYRKMEVDHKIFNRANDVFAKELQGGKQLTREALASALERRKIFADGIRLSCIMMRAELDGIICSGARLGRQFTYALIDERVPKCTTLTGDEALVELTKRYFNSRGPATLKDFAIWSGLTVTQVKKGMGLAGTGFLSEKVDGELYYFPYFDQPRKKVQAAAVLLPPYDEYIMGYKNRDAIFLARNKTAPSVAMPFNNTIIINGQVAGSWRRTMQNNSVNIEYDLFKSAQKTTLALFKQGAKRFARFVGLPITFKTSN